MFIDNAYLIILAIGMTFVLVIVGIDLSVGSVLYLVCRASANLLENKGMNPYLVRVILR